MHEIPAWQEHRQENGCPFSLLTANRRFQRTLLAQRR